MQLASECAGQFRLIWGAFKTQRGHNLLVVIGLSATSEHTPSRYQEVRQARHALDFDIKT